MKTRSTEFLGSLVENWSHRTVSTFLSLASSQVFLMWARKVGAISTAKTLPFSPTSAANFRVNRPVTEATSATTIPGLSLQAATISLALAAISRLSPSNFLVQSLGLGFSNCLLIPGVTPFSWAVVEGSVRKQRATLTAIAEKRGFIGCPY